MKKFVPVIIVAAVLLLILIVVAQRKSTGVNKNMKPSAAAPGMVGVQKKQQAASLLQQAKSAYDTKNYPLAIQKSQEVLSHVDSTSQEAKNLLQISQIRMMDQAPTAAPAAVKAPVAVIQAPAVAVVKAPVTGKTK